MEDQFHLHFNFNTITHKTNHSNNLKTYRLYRMFHCQTEKLVRGVEHRDDLEINSNAGLKVPYD